MNTQRVEAVIEKVMAEHPGVSTKAQAAYYEAVNQELAPLARNLERELCTAAKKVDDLAALVRRLAHALRKAAPNIDLPKMALEYLNSNGIPTSVLRETGHKQ